MNTKKTIRNTLLALVLMSLLGMSAWAVKAYQTPLGPALESAAPTKSLAGTQNLIGRIMSVAQDKVCDETAAWNVLVLGSDAADLRGEKGSDFTRMIRVDFPNKKVTIFAFSRDLWVDTTGLGLMNPTINATQLGEVFYQARSRSTKTNVKDALIDGTDVSARMLSKNFSISTDHYVSIELSQLPIMVDVIGGVPINIPTAITDPWIGMVIPAGQQTLNGAQFVAYARAIPDSDFARIERNNLLLSALQKKLLDPAVWASIPELYTQFKDVIATDLSPEQINHLACLLKEIPTDAINQDQVKPEWTSPGPRSGSLLWDKTKVFNRLKELGLIP